VSAFGADTTHPWSLLARSPIFTSAWDRPTGRKPDKHLRFPVHHPVLAWVLAMPKRRLTKAKTRQQERRQAEIRRRERLLAPTAASGGWYEAFNPDPFRPPKKREPQKRDQRDNLSQVNQVKKQEKQPTPQCDWEGTGADRLIRRWLKDHGSPTLPRHPAEGSRTNLIRAVEEKFAGQRCPGETTIHDRINKWVEKREADRQKVGLKPT